VCPALFFNCCCRSLGDFAFKHPQALLSAEPHVTQQQLAPSDKLVVLTSDGVTDVLPDDDMLGVAMRALEQVRRQLLGQAARACWARGCVLAFSTRVERSSAAILRFSAAAAVGNAAGWVVFTGCHVYGGFLQGLLSLR
jgi:hypothetical protein